jgi:hypothetical protein
VSIKLTDPGRAAEAFQRCVELAPKSCLAMKCQQ